MNTSTGQCFFQSDIINVIIINALHICKQRKQARYVCELNEETFIAIQCN